MEGIGQLCPAVHRSLMEGISAAQELKDRDDVIFTVLIPQNVARSTEQVSQKENMYTTGKEHAKPRELTASRRVATSSIA